MGWIQRVATASDVGRVAMFRSSNQDFFGKIAGAMASGDLYNEDGIVYGVGNVWVDEFVPDVAIDQQTVDEVRDCLSAVFGADVLHAKVEKAVPVVGLGSLNASFCVGLGEGGVVAETFDNGRANKGVVFYAFDHGKPPGKEMMKPEDDKDLGFPMRAGRLYLRFKSTEVVDILIDALEGVKSALWIEENF